MRCKKKAEQPRHRVIEGRYNGILDDQDEHQQDDGIQECYVPGFAPIASVNDANIYKRSPGVLHDAILFQERSLLTGRSLIRDQYCFPV
jgi:hypothetical protein